MKKASTNYLKADNSKKCGQHPQKVHWKYKLDVITFTNWKTAKNLAMMKTIDFC